MSKEFGVFKVNEARLIRQRVLGDTRSLMSGDSGDNSQHENEYFAVVVGLSGDPSSISSSAIAAASNPIDGFVEIEVRIFKYDNYSERTLKLVEGETGLITVIHRFEGVGLVRGMFTTIRKFREEWKFDSIDCGPSEMLLALLEETDPIPSE